MSEKSTLQNFSGKTDNGHHETSAKFAKLVEQHNLITGQRLIMFLDVETTGLPARKSRFEPYYHYTDLDKYNSSRVVQVSWLISNNKGDILTLKDYIIKPDNFFIGSFVAKIHGITDQHARKHGVPVAQVFDELKRDMINVSFFVAHNLKFDKNVMMSEFHRYGRKDMIKIFDRTTKICTGETTLELKKIKLKFINEYKMLKLSELYEYCFDKPIENAHNAKYDTINLYKCFFHLLNSKKMYSVVFDEPNSISFLNEAQQAVVKERLDKNILIVACAGSGKTTTIIHRIKHLVSSGVNPESIVLTTFTRDATNDMRRKLTNIFGYRPEIELGTLDSLSKKNLARYDELFKQEKNAHVSEYGVKFRDFLKSGRATNYLETKKYLFVDEYQDISDVQHDIITEFYKAGAKLVAVGDDAQNIYSFRGSNMKHILQFKQSYADVIEHKLTVNYRSSPEIVDFANESIKHNKGQIEKDMIAANPSVCEKPTVECFATMDRQNASILKDVRRYIEIGFAPHQIAVLCPTNQGLYLLEELLTKEKIDNVLLDGKADVRSAIKDGYVCLSTAHKAKGLEWDIVFIIGLNDKYFPMSKSSTDVQETRRLFYVAVTRPKKFLHMSFVPTDSKFVTRFVGEVDRGRYNFINFKPEYIGQYNDDVTPLPKLSVTELIKNLDGVDYVQLKKTGIIPEIHYSLSTLYNPYEYHDFVKNNDAYADFGIFVDCLITRMFGQIRSESGGLHNHEAFLAIHSVKLNNWEKLVYGLYYKMFTKNLETLTKEDDGPTRISKLEQGLDEKIKMEDKATVHQVLDKLFDVSIKHNIPLEIIPIFTEQFLPDGFEGRMELNLARYKNKDLDWAEVLPSIWDVSKCTPIVKEMRRRMLYKNISSEDVLGCIDMYNDIRNHFVEIYKTDNVKCHERFRLDNHVHGELDMRVGKTIVDYKTSNTDELNLEWTIQLLCYAHLCSEKGVSIDTLQIFNPLKGQLWTGGITDWVNQGKGKLLIDYLLAKRAELDNRTKVKDDLVDDVPQVLNRIEAHKPQAPTPVIDFFKPLPRKGVNLPVSQGTRPNMLRLRF